MLQNGNNAERRARIRGPHGRHVLRLLAGKRLNVPEDRVFGLRLPAGLEIQTRLEQARPRIRSESGTDYDQIAFLKFAVSNLARESHRQSVASCPKTRIKRVAITRSASLVVRNDAVDGKRPRITAPRLSESGPHNNVEKESVRLGREPSCGAAIRRCD